MEHRGEQTLRQGGYGLGIPPSESIENGLARGMDRISIQFDEGRIYLPQILMASKAMEAALDIIEPYIVGKDDSRLKGIVVMGSVKGDIHSIGKNVCCAMLRGAGFKVVDLGVDVSSEEFSKAAVSNHADVVAGSALMTVSLPQQKEIVRIFREDGLTVYTIFGGASCSPEWVQEIGGDGYSSSGSEIVSLVRRLLTERPEKAPGTRTAAPMAGKSRSRLRTYHGFVLHAFHHPAN